MKRHYVRIIALIIAMLMVFGLFSGALAFLVWGAGDPRIISIAASPPIVFSGERIDITITGENLSGDTIVGVFELWSNTLRRIVETSGDGISRAATLQLQNTSGYNIDYSIKVSLDGGATWETHLDELIITVLASGGDRHNIPIFTADTTVSRQLKTGEETRGLTITFYFADDIYFADDRSLRGDYSAAEFSIPSNSSFAWSRNSTLRIDSDPNRRGRDRGRLTNITYNGGGDRLLRVNLTDMGEYFEIPIPPRFFEGEEDEDKPPVSDIVVENVVVRNASGQRLLEVTEDTPPFTVEITYYDVGLAHQTRQELAAAKLHAFVTNAAGFKTLGGTRGRLELLSAGSEQYPRFRAVFDDIQSDGSATSFGFRVQYDLREFDDSIKGEAAANLFQVTKEEEEDERAPLRPRVIVESYSFGDEAITAGDEFDLELSFKNTSRTIGVENVEMTIEPDTGFRIMAASSTSFFDAISMGESMPHMVALRANPAAAGAAIEYGVTVKFSYQFLSNNQYVDGESSVKIAIPVVQLDRFSADEITDYTSVLQIGEEGYISVPVINRGSSPTRNITGVISMPGGVEFVAPNTNFGNLDAGKSGIVDINITIMTPGQFDGLAVIHYEDENMNRKEITVPFSIMVMEPFVPPPEMPPDIGQQAAGAVSPIGMGIAGAGGLMVAGPIALYFIKRMKTKGSEDMDEDF